VIFCGDVFIKLGIDKPPRGFWVKVKSGAKHTVKANNQHLKQKSDYYGKLEFIRLDDTSYFTR
jgi:hypothetical protein